MPLPRTSSRAAAMVAILSMLLPSLGSAFPDPPPGSSSILLAGRVRLRVTNQGHLGRLAWDTPGVTPGAQWPGPSGIEYLQSIELFVGVKDPEAPDPATIKRLSFSGEWQPPSLGPEHVIRSCDPDTPGGERGVDDDGDTSVDEEWLDGVDEDFDGMIDEDFAAFGDRMLSWTMREDTFESFDYSDQPPHVPIGIECRQRVWAYDYPSFADFVVVEYVVRNQSGHELDSVVLGWQIDLSSGPRAHPGGPGSDDAALTDYPSATLVQVIDHDDPRRQHPHDPIFNFWAPPDSALCPRLQIGVQGYSIADDDADLGATIGVPTLMLVDHTIDPTAVNGPNRIGFRAFRSTRRGVPASAGGLPTTDLERYAFATSTEGVDALTGAPLGPSSEEVGDQVAIASVGPFLHWQASREIRATIVFAVAPGALSNLLDFSSDRAMHASGSLPSSVFLARYPSLANAYGIELAFDGDHTLQTAGLPTPDNHGREVALRGQPGMVFEFADCRDMAFEQSRTVTDDAYTMFDFDCDFCTGAYDYITQQGYLHRTWVLPEPTTIGVAPASAPGVDLGRWMPNPTRETASIRLELDRASAVGASIHDVNGRVVRMLGAGSRPAGASTLVWDGRDASDRPVRSGVYWLRLEVDGRTHARRLIRLAP